MPTITYTEFRQAVMKANGSLMSICDKLYNNVWLAKEVTKIVANFKYTGYKIAD